MLYVKYLLYAFQNRPLSLYPDEQILVLASQSKLEFMYNRHDDHCEVFCEKCLLCAYQYLDEQILVLASHSKLEYNHDDLCFMFDMKYLLYAYQYLLMSLYLDEQILILATKSKLEYRHEVLYEIFTLCLPVSAADGLYPN
jgi:hypothetical protein